MITPISTSQNKACRLATGIALVILGILVLGVAVANARFDLYAGFVSVVNLVTGSAMVVFHGL